MISCESEVEERRSMLKSPRNTADLGLEGGEIGERSLDPLGYGQLREGDNKGQIE